MNDYKLIACYNLLYKVISKVLARRLKTILPDAIKSNQITFIKGRLLLENVLLALELVNGYYRTSNSNRATMKFDISKAFDTIKWSFITSFLKAMGLPAQFILWIKVCISIASFYVNIKVAWKAF